MTNFNNKLIQGDVVLRKIDNIPTEATKLTTKVVQPSETHGKYHRFAQNAAVNVFETGRDDTLDLSVNSLSPDSGRFIEVLDPNGALLYHGKEHDLVPNKDTATDHAAMPVPPGLYEVVIVSEYNYDTEMPKRVVD